MSEVEAEEKLCRISPVAGEETGNEFEVEWGLLLIKRG